MTDTRPDVQPGGQPSDHPEGIRTDDWGTSGDLREQITRALEQRWNADDPGATTLDDDSPPSLPDDTGSADTAATPDPAPEPSPSGPSQRQPDEAGAGDGRAADTTGGAATPDVPAAPDPAPTTPPSADEFDAGKYLNDYFGTNLTREQAEHVAGVIGGLQALSPEQRRMLDEALSGGQPYQYPATTGTPAQPAPQMQQAQGQPPADDPAVAVLGPRPDNDEYAAQQWDTTARAVRYNHEQTSALRADIDAQTRAELARTQAANQARIDNAANDWRSTYSDLSDGEFQALSDRAVRSGTFPALVAAHHGDVDAATRALYEQTFWSDPDLRARAIANISSGRAPGDSGTVDPSSPVAQSQAEVDAGRQALASSVSGGGGSVPRASTGVPADPAQRKAAMVAEIQAQGDFT